jgi:hypothetical protein
MPSTEILFTELVLLLDIQISKPKGEAAGECRVTPQSLLAFRKISTFLQTVPAGLPNAIKYASITYYPPRSSFSTSLRY